MRLCICCINILNFPQTHSHTCTHMQPHKGEHARNASNLRATCTRPNAQAQRTHPTRPTRTRPWFLMNRPTNIQNQSTREHTKSTREHTVMFAHLNLLTKAPRSRYSTVAARYSTVQEQYSNSLLLYSSERVATRGVRNAYQIIHILKTSTHAFPSSHPATITRPRSSLPAPAVRRPHTCAILTPFTYANCLPVDPMARSMRNTPPPLHS